MQTLFIKDVTQTSTTGFSKTKSVPSHFLSQNFGFLRGHYERLAFSTGLA